MAMKKHTKAMKKRAIAAVLGIIIMRSHEK
jgi:hypothetical protein